MAQHSNEQPHRLSWEDNPHRALVRLAWPITLSGLSFAAMGVVDTLMVSRLGQAELAGVGLGAVISLGIMGFGFGLLRGVKVLLSQARGAGAGREARVYVGAGVLVALWLGVLMAGLGQLAAELAAMLASSEEAARAARSYVSVRTLGAPIMLTYVALREARYGLSDSRTPLVSALIGNISHALLDYVALFVLGLGVQGAALAGIVAFAIQTSVLIGVQLRDGISFGRAELRAQRAVVRVGVLIGLQWLFEIGSMMTLTVVLAGVSDREVAAHQVAMQVTAFSFLPALSLAEAATVLVAEAVGRGRLSLVARIAHATLKLSLVYALLCGALFVALGATIAGVFSEDEGLRYAARSVLLAAAVHQLFDAGTTVGHGVLRGVGAQATSARIAIGCAWLCTPLLGLLLARVYGLGAPGGWIAMSVEMIAASALVWWHIERLGWISAARRSRRLSRAASAPAVS
jgi:MATE family multidrug resistance protein